MSTAFKPGDRVQRTGTVRETREGTVRVEWDRAPDAAVNGADQQWLAAKAVEPAQATDEQRRAEREARP